MKVPKGLYAATAFSVAVSLSCLQQCWELLAEDRKAFAFYFAFLFAINAHQVLIEIDTIKSYRRL